MVCQVLDFQALSWVKTGRQQGYYSEVVRRRANLFRMRQVYEAHAVDDFVAALPRQLPWMHNLIILAQSKHAEEREFYLRMAVQERWGKRELERQFRLALFERTVPAPPKVSPVVRQSHPQAANVFSVMGADGTDRRKGMIEGLSV